MPASVRQTSEGLFEARGEDGEIVGLFADAEIASRAVGLASHGRDDDRVAHRNGAWEAYDSTGSLLGVFASVQVARTVAGCAPERPTATPAAQATGLTAQTDDLPRHIAADALTPEEMGWEYDDEGGWIDPDEYNDQ
jgi:hypothetical protein